MSKAPTNDVFVTLTNLEPADTETKLELVDVNTGKYKFITRPTDTSASIVLRNTVTEAGSVGTVELSSLYFNDATASIQVNYFIPGSNMKLTDTDIPNYDTDFTLYTNNPGNSWYPSGSFGNFKASRNGTIGDIEISSDIYDTIQQNGGVFYVRFWSSNRFYVASVNLNSVMNGEVTLNFNRQ